MREDRPDRTLGADPRTLRAIAHPVRNRILAELEAAGPQRAADVATALGIPANQASFHLRQLAKYGLVVEAPEAARDNRDRVWKLASDEIAVNLEQIEATTEGRVVGDVFRREASRRAHAAVDAAYARPKDDPERRRVMIAETALRLTPDEARGLSTELNALVDTWRRRTQGPGPSRRTYSLFQLLQVYPDDERVGGEASGPE